ncbi:MAG: helical backbone metal receptor [Acidobacteriota bacterium]
MGEPGKAPERIVSLAPNVTEILYALGAGGRIVGVTNFCNYPPEAHLKRRIGGFSNPNLEVIVSLKPDLLIGTPNVGNKESILRLKEHFGFETLLIRAETMEDLYGSIIEIGEAIHEKEKGVDLARKIESEMESIRKKGVSSIRKKVFVALSIDPVIAATPLSYPGALAMLAGADLIPSISRNRSIEKPYLILSMEEIIDSDPDIIIQTLMDAGDQNGKRSLERFWRKWSSLTAVKNDRVFIISGDTILRPSPRAPEGARLLNKLIYGTGANARQGDDTAKP